jgi:DNA-binding PadR family transcriptional regulator
MVVHPFATVHFGSSEKYGIIRTVSSALTPVSYIVLGLLRRVGRATPYDLKQAVAQSIGHFWSFPHSQLYAEPARLAAAGLLDEHVEEGGRRRRTYTLTAAGEEALGAWLADQSTEAMQVRDLGLLKLFFADSLEPEQIVALARSEAEAHAGRLAHYEEVDRHLAGVHGAAFPRAALRMGMLCEATFVRFWEDVAARPPAEAARPAASAGVRTSAARRRS